METARFEDESLETDLLVIGGGIAGITAAVEAAEVGKNVILVEREHYLGGRVVQLHSYFPKLCPPTCGLEINFRRIRQNSRITVMTGAEPTVIEGDSGNYKAGIQIKPRYVNENCTACGDCEKACEIEVDDSFNFGMTKAKAIRLTNDIAFPYRYFIEASAAGNPDMKKIEEICPAGAIDLGMQAKTIQVDAKAVIWATGWMPYDAARLEGMNFDALDNVVTNMMFERIAALCDLETKITRPSDGAPITKAAFVQCAGSRDRNHLPYCSAVCCMASLKQSRYIREQYPDAEIHIFFIDARTPGRWEDFFQAVQDDDKTVIHRGKVAKIEKNDENTVTLIAENTLTGKLENVTVDIAILATGMVPVAKTDNTPGSMKKDDFGFLYSNGIISTGVAAGPKDVAAANEDATGAVLRALQQMPRV